MLYLTIQKELLRRRRITHYTQQTPVPKVRIISLLNPPCSYRLIHKKGMAKVVKLFI